jgi:hypothetical protein
MKKYILILFLFFPSIFGRSQNLVPNSSFENYTACPTTSGQIIFASPWYNATTSGSTDFFNSCSTSGYGVPKHGSIGYQYPNTGNGYVGIWVFSLGSNYREYLQVQLTNPLSTGSCYFIEYYVNQFNTMKYALNSVDAHFSSTAINTTGTGDVLNLTPQIRKFTSTGINDTLLWTKISGIYMAIGGEQYLTIGNFYDDLNTDTINTGSSYYGSYYYIDDISVISIDSIPGGMPAFAGNDVNVIPGDSVFIGQEISNLNCNWYNASGSLIASNISGIYVQPTSDTYYVVEQNLCGTITYDTVNVNVSGVGINENKFNSIKVYPNPSTGNISFELSNSDVTELNIKVIDVTGKIVFDKTINSGERMFNLGLDAPNGIYMLFINDPNTNQRIVKRIVIQK